MMFLKGPRQRRNWIAQLNLSGSALLIQKESTLFGWKDKHKEQSYFKGVSIDTDVFFTEKSYFHSHERPLAGASSCFNLSIYPYLTRLCNFSRTCFYCFHFQRASCSRRLDPKEQEHWKESKSLTMWCCNNTTDYQAPKRIRDQDSSCWHFQKFEAGESYQSERSVEPLLSFFSWRYK